MTRTINAPAGSFHITVGDRDYTNYGVIDSLYGIAEPMDVIEIRLSRNPHKYKEKLPMVFRGVITEVRRDESIGQDGKPQRTVIVSGHDWGKFLQIYVDKKLKGNPLNMDWLSNTVMETHYKIPYRVRTAGNLMTEVVDKVANKFMATFDDANTFVPYTIDVSSAYDKDMVMPQGYNSNSMNSLWDFIKVYGDLGAFNEWYIDDLEDSAHIIYRKPPFYAGTESIYGTVNWESVAIEANQVQRLSVSRSDADVANVVWVDHPRMTQYTGSDYLFMQMGQNPDDLLIKTPNSTPSLYGIRSLDVTSQHGNIEQAAPESELTVSKSAYKNYLLDKIKKLKLANQDNVVLEKGSMVVQGNEDIKVGRILTIQRSDFVATYYAQSVTHTFAPFRAFTTTVNFIRGGGFDQRSRNDAVGVTNPYLQEIGRGPYEDRKK